MKFTGLLLFMSATLSLGITQTNEACKAYQNNKAYIKPVPFDDKICYFTVENATNASNNPVDDFDLRVYFPKSFADYKWFFFNVSKARSICRRHNATLPVIKSEAELNFVWANFNESSFGTNSVNFVALGLKVTESQHFHDWDDATTFVKREESIEWYWNKGYWNQEGVHAIIARTNIGPKKNLWQVVGNRYPFDSPVGVLCKYNKDVRFVNDRAIYNSAAIPECCLVIILTLWRLFL